MLVFKILLRQGIAYLKMCIRDRYSADYAERRQNIIDTMIKDAEMRSKAKLIDGFIQKNERVYSLNDFSILFLSAIF